MAQHDGDGGRAVRQPPTNQRFTTVRVPIDVPRGWIMFAPHPIVRSVWFRPGAIPQNAVVGYHIRLAPTDATVRRGYVEERTMAKPKPKIEKVMGEFKRGTLHSGSKAGPKVTARDQAIAIGMSEARKAGQTTAKGTRPSAKPR